jgi:hypothetical protein
MVYHRVAGHRWADFGAFMIRIPCTCGFGLLVPESEAGNSVQCPRCGRLRSIPSLEELPAMEADGTIRLSGGDAPPVPPALRDFPTWTDPNGVDRRSSLEQILKIAPPPDPKRPVRRPHYDPETGELVREFDLAAAVPRPQAPPAALLHHPADIPPGWPEKLETLPTAAPPRGDKTSAAVPAPTPAPVIPPSLATPHTLQYANHRADYGRYGSGQVPIPLHIRPVYWHTIPLELLQPANVMVMGFVFGIHLLIQALGLMTLLGAIPLALLALWLWLIVLAHYVIVIDETGPERRDEMPSVLRNVSLGDDFITPLWALLTSLAVCFGPAAVFSRAAGWWNLPPGIVAVLALVMAALGAFFFPAVLLTTATSGSILNLAPQRVAGVIIAAPLKYVLSLVVLGVTVAIYAFGAGATGWLTVVGAGWATGTSMALWVAAGAGYLALMIGIYGAHWFSWLLGKIYQEHHQQFPWVLQRHISTRTDPTKILERQRAAQLLAEREEQARRASAQVRARLARP